MALNITAAILADMEFAVELWTKTGAIERVLAVTVRTDIGRAAWAAAVEIGKEQWPGQEITLRQGTRVIASAIC